MRYWRTTPQRSRFIFWIALAAAGCTGDLRPTPGPEDDATDATGKLRSRDVGGGVTETSVDATDSERWIYLDLETGAEVEPAAPESSAAWDLAFQRFKIKTNGGISGSGGMEAAVVEGPSFEAITAAPVEGYLADAEDTDADEDTSPDYAFNTGDGWYAYDPSTHTLTARERVYVVRSVEGAYFKVQVLGYYDAAGSSGWPTLRSAHVDPPVAPAPLVVESAAAPVYLSLASGGPVVVGDPSTSLDWDLSISRTQIATNGGTSGPGKGGARLANEIAPWAPTIGYVEDEALPIPGPPGAGTFSGSPVLSAWYDYDPATHAVSPKDVAFLVRGASGAYARLRVLAYAGGRYELSLTALARRPEMAEIELDASKPDAWVYFSLRRGELAAVETASASVAWDIGLSETRWRTNSGQSGPGQGGALDAGTSDLGALSEAPADGYVVDQMMTLPGLTGAGEFAGSSVLGDALEADPATSATHPRDRAYFVRTADGGFAKLKVLAYDGGRYTIAWSFAGPGERTFE